jgi:hypothetical protein
MSYRPKNMGFSQAKIWVDYHPDLGFGTAMLHI